MDGRNEFQFGNWPAMCGSFIVNYTIHNGVKLSQSYDDSAFIYV